MTSPPLEQAIKGRLMRVAESWYHVDVNIKNEVYWGEIRL
jgi:hypothetical protein